MEDKLEELLKVFMIQTRDRIATLETAVLNLRNELDSAAMVDRTHKDAMDSIYRAPYVPPVTPDWGGSTSATKHSVESVNKMLEEMVH